MTARRESPTGWPAPRRSDAETPAPRRPRPRPTPAEPQPASVPAKPAEPTSDTATAPETEPIAQPAARRPKVASAGALAGLLVGILGFGLIVQLRTTQSEDALAGARPEDLVRILDDLDSRKERLRGEISSLEERNRQLSSGAAGRDAALAEARRRADELGILAGTLPAEGTGLVIRIESGGQSIKADAILDAVEELRGAGAEAMQITGGNSIGVRIVAQTYFVDDGAMLNVDGQRLAAPYTLNVIGDPDTMRAALNIPGGVGDVIRQRGGALRIDAAANVKVNIRRKASTPRYARPAT